MPLKAALNARAAPVCTILGQAHISVSGFFVRFGQIFLRFNQFF
jgi:hypothetical protein